jgi:hypothetical protein
MVPKYLTESLIREAWGLFAGYSAMTPQAMRGPASPAGFDL